MRMSIAFGLVFTYFAHGQIKPVHKGSGPRKQEPVP